MMKEIDRFEAVYRGDPEAFCVNLEVLRIRAAGVGWYFSIKTLGELGFYSVWIWPNADREIWFELLLDGIRFGGPTRLEVICRGDPDRIKDLQRLWHLIKKALKVKGGWRIDKSAQIEEDEQDLEEREEIRGFKEAFDKLNPRPKQVVILTRTVEKNKDIAKLLFIKEGTVRDHLAAAYKVLYEDRGIKLPKTIERRRRLLSDLSDMEEIWGI